MNALYASLGSAAAAAVVDLVASYTSERSVFIVTAALVLPALGLLLLIRHTDSLTGKDQHPAPRHPRRRQHR